MPARAAYADTFCEEILPAVSRTFAVGIRLLPGELRAAVRDAYLLCRIADTVEDAPNLGADEKASLLDGFAACLTDPSAIGSLRSRLIRVAGDEAHVRLLGHADLVLASFACRSSESRAHIIRWVTEMATGMRRFVIAYPEGIRIQSLEEYHEYCYYVAGTVGYLLTDLWREHCPSIGDRQYHALRERARAFAQALQTVNILRDIARDAEHENSMYVPEELLREHGSAHATLIAADRSSQNHAAVRHLMRLAWTDIDHATAYLVAIPRRAASVRLFCALPLLFAAATLRELARHPGATVQREAVKISRAEVKAITLLSRCSVRSNRALAWLVAHARLRVVSVPFA